MESKGASKGASVNWEPEGASCSGHSCWSIERRWWKGVTAARLSPLSNLSALSEGLCLGVEGVCNKDKDKEDELELAPSWAVAQELLVCCCCCFGCCLNLQGQKRRNWAKTSSQENSISSQK